MAGLDRLLALAARRCGSSGSQVTSGQSSAPSERPDDDRPAGKAVAGGDAHQQRQRLRDEQDRARRAAPAARRRTTGCGATARSRGRRAPNRRARAGRAARRCRRRSSRPSVQADAQADQARLAHAPEGRAPARRSRAPGAGRVQGRKLRSSAMANEATTVPDSQPAEGCARTCLLAPSPVLPSLRRAAALLSRAALLARLRFLGRAAAARSLVRTVTST